MSKRSVPVRRLAAVWRTEQHFRRQVGPEQDDERREVDRVKDGGYDVACSSSAVSVLTALATLCSGKLDNGR